MNQSKYIILPRSGIRLSPYQSVGHSAGDKLWWVGADGRVKFLVSTGKEFHHDISPLDMDARWRGRLDKVGTCSLLPPVSLYSQFGAEDMPLPDSIMTTLERKGAKRFYLDCQYGLRKLGKRRGIRKVKARQ